MPEVRPIAQKEAFAFIKQHHRHHDVPVGALWHHAVHDQDGRLCGIAKVGRPVARKIDEGLTCKVTRLCTNGTYSAYSLLYSATRRVALDKGFRRGVTYILSGEDGASLRVAGWRFLGKTKGGTWNRPSRGRIVPKCRYCWGAWPEFEKELLHADIA